MTMTVMSLHQQSLVTVELYTLITEHNVERHARGDLSPDLRQCPITRSTF